MHPVDLRVTYVHYERLMGLDRQRSEAFGPVHYEGYIWHWSTRQPRALHCWVPAAPDVRWLPGPRSFNRAGIVSYSNSWAFGFLSKKTHSRTCSYTHKQVEKNVHRTDATPPTPSKFPMKCDGQTAVLTNKSMWECGFCAGPKLKPHCFKAKWGKQDITKDFLKGK